MSDENPISSAVHDVELQRVFLGRLTVLLERGHFTYKNYLSNNKNFLHAKILKDNNGRIRQLILSHCHVLPNAQQLNAIQLVYHIDVWCCLWEDSFDTLTPGIFDTFSFENKVNFPADAVNALISYYKSLENRAGRVA